MLILALISKSQNRIIKKMKASNRFIILNSLGRASKQVKENIVKKDENSSNYDNDPQVKFSPPNVAA